MNIARQPFSIEVPIGQAELLLPWNHVHHADLVRLLEQGRLKLLDFLGVPHDELLAGGFALVITRIEVTYKREVREGTALVVCDGGTLENKRMTIFQKILNERGKEAVTAAVECACMHLETRRAIPMPPHLEDAYRRWIGATAV